MATTSKPKAAKTEKRDGGIQTLLLKIVKGKDLLKRPKDATLFSQGEKADAIYFVQWQGPANGRLASSQEGGACDNGSS